MELDDRTVKRSQQTVSALYDEWTGYSQQCAGGVISEPKLEEMILSILVRAYNLGYQDGWVRSHTRTSDSILQMD